MKSKGYCVTNHIGSHSIDSEVDILELKLFMPNDIVYQKANVSQSGDVKSGTEKKPKTKKLLWVFFFFVQFFACTLGLKCILFPSVMYNLNCIHFGVTVCEADPDFTFQ